MSIKDVEDSLRFLKSCRRGHNRFKYKTELDVKFKNREEPAISQNLSLGGIFILTSDVNIKTGDPVELDLKNIPGVSKTRVNGEIRWFVPEGEKLGCGIKFKNLNEELMNAIVNLSNNEELREM
ncbi:MAG: PilZ domain-containing protein [Deltaproteobacteria bacterium]|jgi:Tfp pilus assembly protein PilZ|nr:PilZ domain-containing protein [Deltaproteobacteria bacterium]